MPKKKVSSNLVLNLLSAYLPVLFWAGLIFIMSAQGSLHGFELDTFDFVLKKSAHVVEYFILYYLLHRALSMTMPHQRFNWLIAFILCVAYAISDEWHQSFVSGRTASLRDVGFDSIGVSLAFLRIYRYI